MTIAWACPKPLSYGGRACDLVPACGEPGHPIVGRVALDRHGRCLAAGPRVEPGDGPCSAQRPARHGRGRATGRSGTGAPRAAAGSAAGRRRPSCRTRRAARRPAVAIAGQSVCGGRWPGVELGRMALAQVEAEAAVVQVDPGVRFGQPRAESGGVRLDQRDAHALAVDGAQVGRVAVAARCPPVATTARCRSCRSARRSTASRCVAVGRVAEHVGTVEAGGRGRLDQQVREANVVGVGRQVEPAGQLGRSRA